MTGLIAFFVGWLLPWALIARVLYRRMRRKQREAAKAGRFEA